MCGQTRPSLAGETDNVVDAWGVSYACRSDKNSHGRLSSRVRGSA